MARQRVGRIIRGKRLGEWDRLEDGGLGAVRELAVVDEYLLLQDKVSFE